MSIELDKDLADTLTPEELAAIKDEEYSPEELAAMRGIVGDDDDDEEDIDLVVNPESTKVEELKVADPDPVIAPVVTPVETPEPADTSRVQSYSATLPENYNDLVKAANSEADELAKQLNDGELEMTEYTQKLATLNEHRAQLRDLRTKAELLDEINQQNSQQAWQRTVNTFVDQAAKTDGIDYRKDADKAADLDLFVKRLADNPANNERPMAWFMSEAHKRVMALHGIQKAAEPTADVKKDVIAEARKARQQPISELPKSLAQVPGADGPGDIGGGEFSDMDSLDGLELEDAIAKMSPAQRERFLTNN